VRPVTGQLVSTPTARTPKALSQKAIIATAALIPPTIAMVITARNGARGYTALGIGYPGPVTALASTAGRTVAVLASTLCMGGLATAVLLGPQRDRDRLCVERSGARRIVLLSAAAWGLSAAVLMFVDAADAAGRPIGSLGGRGFAELFTASYLPPAWLVTSACAGAVAVTTGVCRSWAAHAFMLLVSAVGVLAPLMVGQVLIGPNHDLAGDATVLGAPAEAVWFGSTAVLLICSSVRGGSGRVLHRYLRLSVVCWVVVVASQSVVAAVETEGSAPLGTSTGRLFAVEFALLVVAGVLPLRRLIRRRRGGAQDTLSDVGARRFLGVSTMLVGGCLGVELARLRIPSPQYFVPTSLTQTFLGYDLEAGPGVAELALHWRVNLLFCTLATIGVGGYLLAVRHLARRGDHWPVGRTIGWVVGWTLVVITTSSGVGRFSGGTFSAHMVLHMSLNMVAPLFLVLGGPLMLVLRAARAHPQEEAGPREWVTALRGWGLTRALYHPVHALVAFTATSYLLYFSGLFGRASQYHWAHILMNLAYLGIGYLFFSLITGIDPPPRPLPYLARFGLIMAAMPFHAFFGVVVMTTRSVIARGFYERLSGELPWMTDLLHDQYLGGGIAWAAGEVPLTVAVIALLVQWTRQDDRQARRVDRHLDAGLDDSYDVYNAMLARLAAADAAATERDAGSRPERA
jgi:cytochrome c oxidase assembly factor CtaG